MEARMSKKRTVTERSEQQETTEVRDLTPKDQSPEQAERVVGGLRPCAEGQHIPDPSL
jgi:hypothetical protein